MRVDNWDNYVLFVLLEYGQQNSQTRASIIKVIGMENEILEPSSIYGRVYCVNFRFINCEEFINFLSHNINYWLNSRVD